MIDKNIINKLIEQLNIKNNSNAFSNEIINFIETYDGTNSKEFLDLILAIDAILLENQELKISKKAYDEIASLKENYNLIIKELRDEYKNTLKGRIPVKRPIIALDDED